MAHYQGGALSIEVWGHKSLGFRHHNLEIVLFVPTHCLRDKILLPSIKKEPSL